MTAPELEVLLQAAAARKAALRRDKGAEYTRGDADVLVNFKRVATGVGLSPLQVWWVYLHKHLDAVANYVRAGSEVSTESIEGRLDDIQVYIDLGRGLIAEQKASR